MTPAPVKPTVELSVLESIDIRVGTIVAVADGVRPVLAMPVPNGSRAG